MAAYKARLLEFDGLLQEDVIDVKRLRHLCFSGVPDEGGRRALCWKLMLHYLPLDRSQWNDTLNKKRAEYRHFVEEMVVEPARLSKNGSGNNHVDDHPLNPNPESQWGSFFKDNEVLAQIDKDVRRLCPDIMFFQRGTQFPCEVIVNDPEVERLHRRVTQSSLAASAVIRKGLGITKMESSSRRSAQTEDYHPLPPGSEAHWEVVERILFIYAKLNPGQSYVQGMNEIIGPIYYTFANDPNLAFRENAEADCFWCFIALMGEIRDFFIRTLDDSESGIGAMMERLMANLRHHDHQLWNRLRTQELRPQFFSFRWLTLLLSQEFDLPDVIRVWDSLFADADRFSYLIQVCTAMMVSQRDVMLQNDFGSNMKILQHYPPVDVQVLLSKATELKEGGVTPGDVSPQEESS
ncbi:TBC1 domain family member 13-like [Eriocheir sinensis]|uniref:TBC1 domain family member 13-like n=1 Tax=Eriocheir sinensis TaxID=95602 RepID=UPI0021C6FD6F|nr:TBC1 domain family member 13-like [Eriocheir sinensis]